MSENRQVQPEADTRTGILRIPADAQQLATAFLHQQLWCWGYDIRHADGNLLLHYGFACQCPPDQTTGSSLYSLHLSEGKIIALWGFGIWYVQADVGSLFLQRYSFAPRLAATIEPPCIWTPTHLPLLSLPSTLEEGHSAQLLLCALLHWISSYEQWIQERRGCGYRQQCLKDWHQTIIPAEAITTTWEQLAGQCCNWPCMTEHEIHAFDTDALQRKKEKDHS